MKLSSQSSSYIHKVTLVFVEGGKILFFVGEHLPVFVNFVSVAFPFSLGNRAREVERVSSRAMRPERQSPLGDFYFSKLLAHFLPFPPHSKHLQQYIPVITLDIFGYIHICLSAKISHQIYRSITKI